MTASTATTYEYGATILRVQGVSKTLGDQLILRDLNLEVKDIRRPGRIQGQVVGLLGPSGMGKTTLFRILAGLDSPDAGDVLVEEDGRPVHRGMVGVVAQSYPLFAHRTVIGNLLVAGRRSGLNGAESRKKAGDLLDKFGLTEHARKYPVQLSGGQRQRVAIAQQFMCSEHFLLMDEPFSGLDLLAVQRVCQMISDAVSTDELKTIIVVTHDISAALEVSDHIWLLGRDRDAQGNHVPGARIQSEYDLCARGLAWREGITNTAEFLDTFKEIREAFPRL